MWQLILGPVLGVFGSAIEKWFALKEVQEKAKEKALDRAHELAVMEKESDLALKRITVEAEVKQSQAEQESFKTSYSFDSDRLTPDGAKLSRGMLWFTVIGDFFCKMIRPVSTVWYQLAVAAIFSWSALELRRRGVEALTTEEFGAVFSHIIYSVIGMAETTLFWWYGIRRMSTAGKGK